MPRIFIPPALRSLADGSSDVDVPGDTVRKVIDSLNARFPGMGDRLRDGDDLKPGLAVAIDGHVSSLGLLARVQPDSEVHFLPAIGGG